MDFEKLQRDVEALEQQLGPVKEGQPAAVKQLVVGLRDVLTSLLKDRREPIRPGQIFKDAAAKSLVPGDLAPRGDALIVRWGGGVTPQDPAQIKEDASRLSALAEKVLPILKAYRKVK
jgi:hypothetical protein